MDLYLDLKERHLLPIVVVLIAGIIAVPFVFGRTSDSSEAGSGEPEAAISAGAPPDTQVAVAKSTPGLRRYQQRLDYLRAKDPFKPRIAESATEPGSAAASPEPSSAAGGSESANAGAETSVPLESSGTSTETIPPIESSGPEGSPAGEPEPTPESGGLRYYSYAIDVRVGTNPESQDDAESQAVPGSSPDHPAASSDRNWSTRRDLPELTMLPSRETPAVVYMGSTKDGKKALMLISSDVTSIFGDAKCALGSKTCQLLAMEPGVPETFVYGPAGRTFKIELLKVHLVETEKLNRAPLGKPKQKKN
jgi:hypothetical protein